MRSRTFALYCDLTAPYCITARSCVEHTIALFWEINNSAWTSFVQFVTCIWVVLRSILGQTSLVSTDGFLDCPQSLQENAGIVPEIR
jgi:hypothetical protein